MLGETWEDQYRRMKRSYARVKIADEPHEVALDALYHFCADVLHFRDWIRKSPLIDPAARDDVEKLITANKRKGTSVAIQACADVANAAKHFELRDRAIPPAEIVGHKKGLTLPYTLPATFERSHFVISTDDGTHSSIEIADQAVTEWNDWLTRWNLAIPT